MNPATLAPRPEQIRHARAAFAEAFLTTRIRRVREQLESDGLGGEIARPTYAAYFARLVDLSQPREMRLASGEVAEATQLLQVPFGADIRPTDDIEMPSGERYSVIALAEPRAIDMAQRLYCRPIQRSTGRHQMSLGASPQGRPGGIT